MAAERERSPISCLDLGGDGLQGVGPYPSGVTRNSESACDPANKSKTESRQAFQRGCAWVHEFLLRLEWKATWTETGAECCALPLRTCCCLVLRVTRMTQSLQSHACGQGLCSFASALDGFGLLALQPGVAGAEQFGGRGEVLLKAAYLGVQAGHGCLDVLAQSFEFSELERSSFEGFLLVGVIQVFLLEIMGGFGE